jgi:glutathione S-transferase
MQLYHSPTTPFGRKIMVQVLESGLTDRVEVLSVMGTPVAPGTLPVDRNPLGKIPALIADDGMALYDSRVISRYLDDLSGAGLYPAKPALWGMLVREATVDGMLDASVLMAYEVRVRPEDKRYPDWIEGQWAKVARSLDVIEAGWAEALAGPLDMAQIGLGCVLSYLDFRHGARNWREGRPQLAAWEAGFAQRPAMQATRPV